MAKMKLVTVGGVYRKESTAAGVYFTGKIMKLPPGIELKEGSRILIFENKKPKDEKSPTHHLMTEDTRPAGSGGGDEDKHKVKSPEGFEGFATPEDKAPW